MTNRSKKTSFKKAGRSNREDRLRIEKERFAGDLDTAVFRISQAMQQQSGIANESGPVVAYWQTAVVKIVRWFQKPRGLKFNPWDYVEQKEKKTMKWVCNLRSQWMTRKLSSEKVIEFMVVNEESLNVIPTDIILEYGEVVMNNGNRIQLVRPDSTHVGKISGSLFGTFYSKEESGPNREVYDLIVRIRDRIRSENGGGSSNE